MKLRHLFLPVVPALATMTIAASPAFAATPEAVSENWAGYEATSTNSDGFSAASGGWVQPSATCTDDSPDYAAFWVGLGGGGTSSDALEQIGTQADCTAGGKAYYYAWYELVPSAPVKLPLKISAGDRIFSRVSVNGTSVTLSLSDQTTGQSATKTLTMTNPNPDTSTAEWIAEAPSTCQGGASGECEPLSLADFGTATFNNAYATSDGHTAAAGSWNSEAVALQPGYSSNNTSSATAGSLSADGSSFSVTYSDQNTGGQVSSTGSGYGYPGSDGPSGNAGYSGSDDYSGGYSYPGGAGYSGGYGDSSGYGYSNSPGDSSGYSSSSGYGDSGGYGYTDGGGSSPTIYVYTY